MKKMHEILSKDTSVNLVNSLEYLRQLYDDRVEDTWENGDSDFELGVSLETLYEIHEAHNLLELLSVSELCDDFHFYRTTSWELFEIYYKWYVSGLKF